MAKLQGAGLILASLMFLLSPNLAHADGQFIVKKIQIEGLQRISEGTLYDYLPVNIGDDLTDARVQDAIRALYKTGFFRDVEFRRDGDTLVIVVKERPSIAHFTVTGNKLVKTEDLTKNLVKVGLVEGQIFNKVTLDGLKQEMLEQYYSHGHYGVLLNTTVTDVGDNRVDVAVTISEGITARIRSINIVGNHDFTESDLTSILKLKVSGFWTYFGSSDEYAREKLVGDLESLRSFYMDQGYADFSIDSTQVAVSPDHNSIYISIGITEGDIYKIKDVKLSGTFVVSEDQLKPYLLLKSGDTFSLKHATETADLIRKRLGVDGYAFAQVNPVPDIDRQNKTVSLNFVIDPGQRAYVRHIDFIGAPGSNDEIFRREMRQFEGAWLSNLDLERSRVRLQRLPWIEDVQLKTNQVPGTANLLDADFTIKERQAGTANIGVGYGSQSGLVIDGQVADANFLGTGDRVSFNATHTAIGHSYNFAFTDPYYTVDGVSRSFNVFQSRVSSLTINSSPLTTASYGAGVTYGIPVSEYSGLGLGLTYTHNELFSTAGTSREYITFMSNPRNGDIFYTVGACSDPFRGFNFICEYPGLRYDTIESSVSFTHDTEDRVIFPTSGTRENLGLTTALPGGSIEYNILSYQQYAFLPLPFGMIYALNSQASLGAPYGKTSPYPPFKNFFVGGPDTVRGWSAGTLGPEDPLTLLPVGGRALLYAQNEFVLPRFGKDQSGSGSYRLAFFVDAGNVFADPSDFALHQLRASYGFTATFLTPLGAMKFSYAFPMNAKPGDQTERFQFTLGAYY